MITLKVFAERPVVQGFSHLWANYVTGFVPTVHCMACLIGHRSRLITRTMPSTGEILEMNEPTAHQFDFIYICGVTRNWTTNFHLVLQPKDGATAAVVTYNGISFVAEGAAAIDIPWLPDGYRGLSSAARQSR